MAGGWLQPGGAVGHLRVLGLPERSILSPPAAVAVLAVSLAGDTQSCLTCAAAAGPHLLHSIPRVVMI